MLDRGTPPLRKTLRFFGPGESQVAQAFHEAGGDGDGLEVTICARNFEIHVDLVAEPSAEERLLELEDALSDRLGRFLYSSDGRGVEEIVLDRCRALGWTLATAESCTGGLVAAALTAIPGSSDVITGGIVAYANEVKTGELGVSAELIERHGAVSAEVAEAMAQRGAGTARRRRRRLDHGSGRPGRWHGGQRRSGSSTSTPRHPTPARAASSAFPETATRSADGRSSPRSTWCGVFWNRIETKPRRDGR